MTSTPADKNASVSYSPPVPESSRRLQRERERLARLHGKLTDLKFSDISCGRSGEIDFIKQGVLVCYRGSKSQFDARIGRMRRVLPPATGDCCQTFATISAVMMSSLSYSAFASMDFAPSTLNYLLYISAWMHQLTQPCWPRQRSRPTISDLNGCLQLREYFPSKADTEEFEVVFYNQSRRAMELLQAMCTTRKRGRSSDDVSMVCGYVIASGDYTISVFSVEHDIAKSSRSARYTEAWDFFICDSHGTQPWSTGKASLSGLTFGHPAHDVDGETVAGAPAAISLEDGLHYFSTILFTLLEEHRSSVVRTGQTPYMTWTALRRRRADTLTTSQMQKLINEQWTPYVLSDPVVYAEVGKYAFRPLVCFGFQERSSVPVNMPKSPPATSLP